MKRGLIIGIIAIVVLVAILVIYFYPSTKCAKEGERFSSVYKDEYLEHCCEGLTEWPSGVDTGISVADECYDTGLLSGYPVGTCINCGNGICEDIEDVCNCPEDCTAENSQYVTVQDFCDESYVDYCGGILEGMELDLCKLCE